MVPKSTNKAVLLAKRGRTAGSIENALETNPASNHDPPTARETRLKTAELGLHITFAGWLINFPVTPKNAGTEKSHGTPWLPIVFSYGWKVDPPPPKVLCEPQLNTSAAWLLQALAIPLRGSRRSVTHGRRACPYADKAAKNRQRASLVQYRGKCNIQKSPHVLNWEWESETANREVEQLWRKGCFPGGSPPDRKKMCCNGAVDSRETLLSKRFCGHYE